MQIKTSVRDHFIPVRTGSLHQVLRREDMDQEEAPFTASRSVGSVQLLSCVWLFPTPWTAARQASLCIATSRTLPKPMSIELVVPSNHLILCHPLLLPSVFPRVRVFSNESDLCIRWPKYWSFSFSISSSNEYSGLISFRTDWFDLLAVQPSSCVRWVSICQRFSPDPDCPWSLLPTLLD